MIFKVLKNIYALKMSLSKIIYNFFKNSIYVFLIKIRVHVVSRFYCNFFLLFWYWAAFEYSFYTVCDIGVIIILICVVDGLPLF